MSINYYNPYVRQELELYHHGILGQRWGKKNGPPYPLGASDHSASEKRAGWRQSLAERRTAKSYERKLNKLDRQIGEHTARIEQGYIKGSKSMAKSKETNNWNTRNKELIKRKKIENKMDLSEKAIESAKAKTQQLLKEMASKGYGFKTKEVERVAINKGAAAVGLALEIVGSTAIANGIVTGNPLLAGAGSAAIGTGSMMVSSSKSVSGNKFNVSKGSGKGSIHSHKVGFTRVDDDDAFKKQRTSSKQTIATIDKLYSTDATLKRLNKKVNDIQDKLNYQVNTYGDSQKAEQLRSQLTKAVYQEQDYLDRKRYELMNSQTNKKKAINKGVNR